MVLVGWALMTEAGWWNDDAGAGRWGSYNAGPHAAAVRQPLRIEKVALVETPDVLVEKAVVATPTPTPVPTATPIPSPEPIRMEGGAAQGSGEVSVYVSFYSCPPYCANPSGPLELAEGQAACDPSYMGRRFLLNGREYVCNDTGNAVWGAHVDLFFWDQGVQGVANLTTGWGYLATYGTRGVLTWLR